jgi:hypothetical protein
MAKQMKRVKESNNVVRDLRFREAQARNLVLRSEVMI